MHSISLGSQPQNFLKSLDKELRLRIQDKLDELKLNPFPKGVEQVLGKKEKSFRVRVGKYRIQYIVLKEKGEIVIFNVDKRERSYN